MTVDVQPLIQRSARLDLEGVDFGSFGDLPLDQPTLRCLRYMHDVESHTTSYLRDLLVTRAHADPEVSAFLACWCYEEHWHGDALARVLAAHGEPAGATRVAALRRSLPRREQFRPILFALGSALSRHMVTVHMAWGAINEWTTQSGYSRLAAKARNPTLSELLHRIMKQEGRHIDFYASQARERLAGSQVAQRFTRRALARSWAPVGSGIMPDTEIAFLSQHLFDDPDGREATRRIDRQIDRLPGLDGLHLVEGVVAGYRRRRQVPPQRGGTWAARLGSGAPNRRRNNE